MKSRFQGYVSWMRLFQGNFPFNASGKLATLWFDELVFQVPSEDIIKKAIEYALDSSSSTLKELRKMWVPVTKFLPNYQFLSQPFKSKQAGVVDVACRVTDEETREEWAKQGSTHFSPNNFGFLHETAWASAGLIESVNVWIALNEKRPCTFLPTVREQKVVQQTFSKPTERKPHELFSEIMNYKIPDLDRYSWEEIVELRHHRFFDEFRDKMVLLGNELNSVPRTKSVQTLVDEITREDMEKMIGLLRPSPRLSAFAAIASNIPLPIPINPLGIILSAKEMRKQMTISKKYGWLYFLMDLPKRKVHD